MEEAFVQGYKEMTDGGRRWFAVHFDGVDSGRIADVLAHQDPPIDYFIPVRMNTRRLANGTNKQEERAVFKNVMFFREPKEGTSDKELLQLFNGKTCTAKSDSQASLQDDGASGKTSFPDLTKYVYIMKYHPDDAHYTGIKGSEMYDFMIFCAPERDVDLIVTTDTQKYARKGDWVVVTRGPLSGQKGVLVRKSKHYYLLKNILGLGLMVQVTKWTCQPIDKDGKMIRGK